MMIFLIKKFAICLHHHHHQHVWKFGFCPNSLKGTLPSTMVCTQHNSIIIHEGDQEDDGDDDVNKLQKIIHHFFS
jgi:hypothetical protein